MTNGATRNTKRITASLERSIVLEPTKKIQTGLLAIALGFGSAAFSLGGATTFGTDALAQTPAASAVLGVNSNAPSYPALVRSQELLLKARRSLMSRDVVAAERYAREAQALNAQYGAASDRPEYVLPLVDQYKRAEAAARAQGMTESVKRELAKSYLEQAEGLRRCQDLDAAENLVAEARKLDVVFDAATIERKMDVASVQRRVADDRLALAAPSSQAPLTGLSEATKRQVAAAQETLRQARVLAANGQTERAEQAVRALQAQGIPENAFAGGDSPAQFLRDVATARSESSIRQVQATVPGVSSGESAGYLYVQEAETALAQGDKETALTNYRDALRYTAELDAATVREINAEIARLSAPAATPEVVATATGIDLTQPGDALQNEIAAFIAKQNQVRETAPKEALADLKQLKAEIEASSMELALKTHFAHALDGAIADSEAFLAANGSRIAIQQQNQNVDAFVAQKRAAELERQARLADDTEKFNDLLEEGRYDEAIVLAEKCADYSGNEQIAVQMLNMAKKAKQVAFNNNLREAKSDSFLQGMNDVEQAAVVEVNDATPLVFNQERWNIAKNRESLTAGSTRSEADLEILRKLETPITLPFDQPKPLDIVVDYIRKNAEINVMVDEAALAEAGVTSDMTVQTNLSNIKLKNYLKHTLTPLGLSYIVEDEVLTITGKNKRSGKFTTQYYPVADLVIGVPNFGNVVGAMSQEASQQRAYQQVANRGLGGASAANTIAGLNQNVFGSNSTLLSPNIAAQIQSSGGNVPLTAGSGGGMNDPSELIDLITSVVGDEETWEMVGDPQFFSLNNTLAIRQTEENHEEIHELLEKLRSLNDLQVAVEVRFITISDEYFERIGVNMNLSFQSDAKESDLEDGQLVPSKRGVYGIYDAGSTGSNTFTENLNVNFTQNSYGLAVPQFGNYDPSVGAQMGFAILSDIESYFFVSAAESDTRTNVLQAPKVTMFNGQTASVSDFTSVPYVSTVIPVVGEFAVAQQPVITVINEGQFMTVQATASPDRKYVRMTVVPFFCKITDNDRTFKFEGTDSVSTNSTSANKGSSILDSITDERETTSGAEVVSAGTTIQEPVTSSFSVYTTVNVPDGGTALLGGIKRLSEGRNEGGVPILSKIPYLKRLFSNSATGREPTSMLMTVTPRIIIQEEEEEFATGANPGRD